MSSTRRCGAPSARRSKPAQRPSPASARRGQRTRSSLITTPSPDKAAKLSGVSPPSRRLPTARLARTGEFGRRTCATARRRRSTRRSSATGQAFEFALFCQWLADRQLARAAKRARGRGLESASTAISRSAPRQTAPSSGCSRALARGVTVGAPPDPFSAEGQNWRLPALNPLAGAREGWASLSADLARQHAARRHAADRSRHGAQSPLSHP